MDRKDQEVFDQETLDRDEAAVSSLVGELKHIEAPANFERRVMLRIVDGAPAKRPFFGMPMLAYAAPLVLLLVGAFVFFQLTRNQTTTEPALAEKTVEQTNKPQPGPTTAALPEGPDNSITASTDTPEEAPLPNQRRSTVTPSNSDTNRGGGSYTTGLDQTRTPNPEGLNPQNPTTSPNRNDVVSDVPLSVKEILTTTIGISTDFSNGWKVTQITGNSTATRSGVQVGDIIVALGDHDISNKTELQNAGSFNSVRVKRGGKLIDIKLK